MGAFLIAGWLVFVRENPLQKKNWKWLVFVREDILKEQLDDLEVAPVEEIPHHISQFFITFAAIILDPIWHSVQDPAGDRPKTSDPRDQLQIP